jgi:hypothetical protein
LVKSSIEQDNVVQSQNPFSIMLELAKATYIEDIMFGKANSLERSEVNISILVNKMNRY